MTETLPSGAKIGRYRLERILGRGGFGITYSAVDEELHRHVAIKEFFPAGLVTRQSGTAAVSATPGCEARFAADRERFLNEARTLARINHPGIVRVIDFLRENQTAYMVMEYIDGVSLAEAIDTGGAFSENRTRTLLHKLLPALQEIHALGLLHLDIKPDNILIGRNNQPVLIDFGAARSNASASGGITASGTPGYAAPEQYEAPYDVSVRTDIYSLAAVLCACLTAKRPPDTRGCSGRPAMVLPKTSRDLSALIAAAMQPDPAARPQSITALAAMLGASSPKPGIRAAAASVLVLLGAGGYGYYLSLPGTTPANPGVSLAVPQLQQTFPKAAMAPQRSPAQEAADYNAAKTIATPDAWRLYLMLNPNGKNATQAEQALKGF